MHMDETHLYQRIAEALRQDILNGRLKLGDRLPSMREITDRWGCTLGTVQRALQELSSQGLIEPRRGKGTFVAGSLSPLREQPMRLARLVHHAEAFLLESYSGGYTLAEIEKAVGLAADHWRSLAQNSLTVAGDSLRFVGSHDMALSQLIKEYQQLFSSVSIQVSYMGSLGGLIALAEGKADITGCHLWDDESDEYNIPFIRKILPGKRLALLTLAHRHLGLIVHPGNPLRLSHLQDLTHPGVRFINRQPGSGTRVWLDVQLKRLGIPPDRVVGFEDEKLTHSALARVIADGQAAAGIGLKAAAAAFGLDFVPLTVERYDLVIPAERWDSEIIQSLVKWLSSPYARQIVEQLEGYETQAMGSVQWLGK